MLGMIITRKAHEPLHEFRSRRRQATVGYFETTDLSLTDIALKIGVNRKYVSQWHTAWAKGDTSFLIAPPVGNKPRLTDEQKRLVEQHILAGPQAAGYEQQLWTQRRIADLILRLTGVSYHPNAIRVVMASMNISYQKPTLRTKQKSEAKKADFLEKGWIEAKRGH